jgi:hypothetical protein
MILLSSFSSFGRSESLSFSSKSGIIVSQFFISSLRRCLISSSFSCLVRNSIGAKWFSPTDSLVCLRWRSDFYTTAKAFINFKNIKRKIPNEKKAGKRELT